MKEKIYTIPINDAFDEKCDCAICAIQNKLNNDTVEYTLGASMMEPEFRIITNEKGFCKNHYVELLKQSKALPLSLVLQTHSEHQNNILISTLNTAINEKKSLFKKTTSSKASAENVINILDLTNGSCSICERIDSFLEKYIINTIYLWKTEPEFKNKFNSKNGFCMPHFSLLLKYALKELNEKQFDEFYKIISEIQISSLNSTYDNIYAFTKMFDYKNSGKPQTENTKNAVKKTIHKYSSLNVEND